ncbi:ParA family protein [Gloeothece verrucosa]|uniref:Cobyrinic acid ac-diamide synthase n=1 Tax=Gloeothece verrucosa (strain PCC 7822) TaxID=497965 RepID=E0UC04_GLOV7|nr:ParA family protein [Gloeothece verrucosa]ADN16342.1 Cobyrinic acid ac-diamide synthase [Gloeothece verrucosa PCC 7822]
MIIAVTALKGGVGKTTTAIHIAAYLQQKAPTLLIDADKNRSALHWSREDTLPFFVASQAGSTRLITKYTHIITDTQARPEAEELEDLVQGSDLLVIPTTPNHLDVDVTVKAVELLQPLKANFKILLTKVDARTRNGREARKTLEELKLPIFKSEIPLLVAYEKASDKGVIVKDISDSRAKFAWSCYEAVGKEIMAG